MSEQAARGERIVHWAPNPERYECGHVVVFGTTVVDRDRRPVGRETHRHGPCPGCRKLADWVRSSGGAS